MSGLRPLLDAIRAEESGGAADPAAAIGDGGRSVGPYQISLAYWLDGGGERGHYRRGARDPAACEAVMAAYWARHCPAALAAGPAGWQTLARTHNGGPPGPTKRTTADYWRRVEARLRQGRTPGPAAGPRTAIDVTDHTAGEPIEPARQTTPGRAASGIAPRLHAAPTARAGAIDGGRAVVPPFGDRAGRPALRGRPGPVVSAEGRP